VISSVKSIHGVLLRASKIVYNSSLRHYRIVGGGYAPVRNIAACVTNALKKASSDKYETMVIPLLVRCAYFTAWNHRELLVCLGFLDNTPEVKFMSPPANA